MDPITALQALIDSLGGEWFTHAITTAPIQFATFVLIVIFVSFTAGYSVKGKQLHDKESELEKTKTDLNSKQAEIDLLNQKHKTELSDIAFRHQKEISDLQNVSQKLETDLVSANSKADRAIEEAKEKFNTEIAIEKIRIENALFGYIPTDLWEENHELNENTLVFEIAKESQGTGTRYAANRLRNVIRNAFEQSGKKILIDFDNTSIVTSSYADELLGKMIEEVGFVKYMTYFSITNVSPINEMMINEALKRHFNIGQ